MLHRVYIKYALSHILRCCGAVLVRRNVAILHCFTNGNYGFRSAFSIAYRFTGQTEGQKRLLRHF